MPLPVHVMITFWPDVLDLQDTEATERERTISYNTQSFYCTSCMTTVWYPIYERSVTIRNIPHFSQGCMCIVICIVRSRTNVCRNLSQLTAGNLSPESEGVPQSCSAGAIASSRIDEQCVLFSSDKVACVHRDVQSTTCSGRGGERWLIFHYLQSLQHRVYINACRKVYIHCCWIYTLRCIYRDMVTISSVAIRDIKKGDTYIKNMQWFEVKYIVYTSAHNHGIFACPRPRS